MKKIIAVISLFIFVISCDTSHLERLSVSAEKDHYKLLKEEILKEKSNLFLHECNCMKAFVRDWKKEPNESSRYAFDRAVGKHAVLKTEGEATVRVLALGSGSLLNELSSLSYVLALGKDLKIYLTDHNYIFYGQGSFEDKAIELAENADLRPRGWKNFYIWVIYKKQGRDAFLKEIKSNHQAIDHFKSVMSRIADHYGQKVTIDVISPPKRRRTQLPKLDMILAIDAFQDVHGILYQLTYPFQLSNTSVRFLSLNKINPLGNYWDSDWDSSENHEVALEVFDVNSTEKTGDYRLIEKKIFYPSDEQINFCSNN